MANNNPYSNGRLKKRYKMYKAGKNMLVAPLVFAGLLVFAPQSAKADDGANQINGAVDTSSVVTNQGTDKNSSKVVLANPTVNKQTTTNVTSKAPSSENNQQPVGQEQTNTLAVKPTTANTDQNNSAAQASTINPYVSLYSTNAQSNQDEQPSIDVTSAAELVNALNGDYKTINIKNNIDFTGAKGVNGENKITFRGSSKKVTINGNGNTIDFNKAYMNFKPSATQSVDIILDNIKMLGYSWWGPFSVNAGLNPLAPAAGYHQTITYRNVHYTGSQLIAAYNTTVNIEGQDNEFNSVGSYTALNGRNVGTQSSIQQNIEAASINIADGAHLKSTTNCGINLAVVGQNGTGLTIGKDADVTLTRLTKGRGETQKTEHDSLLYSAGKVLIKSGATLNVLPTLEAAQGLPKDADAANNGGVLYIDNDGVMTVQDGARLNVANQGLDGTINTPLIFINGNGQLNVNNAVLDLGTTTLGNNFSNIFIKQTGTIRISGPQAKLIADSAGSDTENRIDGVINLHNGGGLFVSDGASFEAQNINSTTTKNKGEYLINVDGASTIAFSKGAKVKLKTTGLGHDAIIRATGTSHITIDRPEYVIFDMQSTGSDSKIFNFSGDVNANHVRISDAPTTTPAGPFKTLNYSLTNGNYANSKIIGQTKMNNTQGQNVAKQVGSLRYLKYVADDEETNFIKIDNKNIISTDTTEITGQAKKDAYISIYYYDQNGNLTLVPDLNKHNEVIDTDGTKVDYSVKSDANGRFSIKLPKDKLNANSIIVVKSTGFYSEAYDTAFVHTPTDAIERLKNVKTGATNIADKAGKAITETQHANLDSNTINKIVKHDQDVVTKANTIVSEANTAINEYGDPTETGNQAAQSALEALKANQAAEEANNIHDLETQKNAKEAAKKANDDVQKVITAQKKVSDKATDLENRLNGLKVWRAQAREYTARYKDSYYAVGVDGRSVGVQDQPVQFYKVGNMTMILPNDQVPAGVSYGKYTGALGGTRQSGWNYANLDSSTGKISFIKDQLASAKTGDYYLPVTIKFNDGSSLNVLEKLHINVNKKENLVDKHELKITGSYNGSFAKGDKLDNNKLNLTITASNGVSKTMTGKELKGLTATVGDNNQVTLNFDKEFGYNNGLFGKNNNGQNFKATITPKVSRNTLNPMMLFASFISINPNGNVTVKDLNVPTDDDSTASGQASSNSVVVKSDEKTSVAKPEAPTEVTTPTNTVDPVTNQNPVVKDTKASSKATDQKLMAKDTKPSSKPNEETALTKPTDQKSTAKDDQATHKSNKEVTVTKATDQKLTAKDTKTSTKPNEGATLTKPTNQKSTAKNDQATRKSNKESTATKATDQESAAKDKQTSSKVNEGTTLTKPADQKSIAKDTKPSSKPNEKAASTTKTTGQSKSLAKQGTDKNLQTNAATQTGNEKFDKTATKLNTPADTDLIENESDVDAETSGDHSGVKNLAAVTRDDKINSVATTTSTKKNVQLPQTGNSKGELIAGVALGSMLALFGFSLSKKREY